MSFPTQLTVLRIVLVPVFYLLFAVVEPAQATWAVGVFLVAALTDWYDGHFARKLNLVTPFGAFLDPLADKLLTSAAFIAFASRGLIPLWMVALVIARDVYITSLRLLSDGVEMSVKTTMFAKVKTFVQMAFIAVVLIGTMLSSHGASIVGVAPRFLSADALYWLMLGVTALTAFTALEYTYDNWRVFAALSRRFVVGRSPQELG